MAASGQRDADQTEASAAYLLTDESCRARIRGRHLSAAGALSFPIAPTQVGIKKKKRGGKKRETEGAPPPLSPLIIEGRERVALSLSASQLTMLHCLNSHFLYKIDALTAALEHTHPQCYRRNEPSSILPFPSLPFPFLSFPFQTHGHTNTHTHGDLFSLVNPNKPVIYNKTWLAQHHHPLPNTAEHLKIIQSKP